MSILITKAKVLLKSEEEMEVEDTYDFGNIVKNKEYVWKSIGIPVEQVYKVVAFDNRKSILYLYDGERMLLQEPFEEVISKWQKLREEDCDRQPFIPNSSDEEEE